MTDWQGRPVPDNEPDDAEIKVWEVDPHPFGSPYHVMWERSWQRMLGVLNSNMDTWLERFDQEDLEAGVNMKFRLLTMTKREYEETIRDA